MVRIKRSVNSKKSRRKTMKQAKGYTGARSRTLRAAKEQVMHAGADSFTHRKDKKGGDSTINFSDKMPTVNQYGGFIIDPPIAKCKSQLDNAIWLNNHNMRRKSGGLGPKKIVTLKEASGRTAYSKFFRFANQQNGGKRKQNKY